MFAIVEFNKSNPKDLPTIEIVYSDWVQNDKVYFPLSSKYRTFINMKVSEANYTAWKLNDVYVLKNKIATMDEAKRALDKYISFNDSQSENENKMVKIQNRKHPARRYNIEKNYNTEFETVMHTDSNTNEKSPAEQLNSPEVLNTDEPLSSILGNAILSYDDYNTHHTETISTLNNEAILSSDVTPETTILATLSSNNAYINLETDKYCIGSSKEITPQTKLDDKINEMCSMLIAIELKLDRLIEGPHNTIRINSENPQLNFKKIEDLTDFENRLKTDSEYRLKISSYFVNTAHKGLSKNLNLGLTKSMLTDLLAEKMSWSGRNKDLPGFVTLKAVQEMILDVLKRRNIKAIITQDDVRHAVKEYLKRI